MKTTLTIEQSAELIKRGVNADRASEIFIDAGEHGMFSTPKATSMMLECAREAKVISPIFTLADLFAMLPKGIIHNGLFCKLRITSWYDDPYFAGYMNQVGKYIMGNPYDEPFSAEELIDVIFELLCWAIDHNHVKLD